MPFQPRPHISQALQHLRLSVAACALALGIALVGQLGVWAAVHFTQARTVEANSDAPRDMRVVSAGEAPPPKAPTATPANAAATGAPPATRADHPASSEPADVNLVQGPGDVVLRGVATLVQTVGVLSALLLAIQMFQAIAIAGGGCVPGVERAVTAATLTFLIVLLSIPLSAMLPDIPLKGVFLPYDAVVALSDRLHAGGPGAPSVWSYYGSQFILPLALITGLAIVILRFRGAIESGIIVTAVSQLDEKIEREIRAARLGQLASPRAMGALNQALGEQPEAAVAPQPAPRPRPIEPVPVAPPAFRNTADPNYETVRPGDSTKRPI